MKLNILHDFSKVLMNRYAAKKFAQGQKFFKTVFVNMLLTIDFIIKCLLSKELCYFSQ